MAKSLCLEQIKCLHYPAGSACTWHCSTHTLTASKLWHELHHIFPHLNEGKYMHKEKIGQA